MFSVPVKADWQAARRNGKTLLTPDSMQFRINSKQGKKIFLECFERKNGCPMTATVDKESDMITRVRGR